MRKYLVVGCFLLHNLMLLSPTIASQRSDFLESELRSAFLVRQMAAAEPMDNLQHRELLQQHFDAVLARLIRNTEASIATAVDRLECHNNACWSAATRNRIAANLRRQRGLNLRRLQAYAQQGRFPQNEGQSPVPLPIFVDSHDTACAVGHLMRLSGWGTVVETIRANNNFVYVTDVSDGPLLEWVLQSGLTYEEAALIQPGYCNTGALETTVFDEAAQQSLVVGDLVLSNITVDFVDDVPEPSSDVNRWDWYRQFIDTHEFSELGHPHSGELEIGTLTTDADTWPTVCLLSPRWPVQHRSFVSLVETELTTDPFTVYQPTSLVPHQNTTNRLIRWEFDVEATAGRLLGYPTLGAWNALTTAPRATVGRPLWTPEEDADLAIATTFSSPAGAMGSLELSFDGFEARAEELNLAPQETIHVSTIVHARGTVYLNNITHEFHVVDSAAPRCDFDMSGTCDIADLNALLYERHGFVPPPSFKYDLDGNGTIDLSDRDWVLNYLDTVAGDFNLDGKVDAADLDILGSNWSAHVFIDAEHGYASGDANGSGFVNAADLNQVALNWLHGTEPDQLTESLVPESSGLSLALAGILALFVGSRVR